MNTPSINLDFFYRRKAKLIVFSGVTIVLLALLLGVLGLSYFRDVETVWEAHSLQATTISDARNELNRQIGYGGFIHNFKNLVLRRDLPRYQEKIDSNITNLRSQLDRLDGLLNTAEDKAALAQVRATFEEYASKYRTVPSLVAAGASSAEIDAVVKVDDGPALKALAYLSTRVGERAREAHKGAESNLEVALRLALTAGALVIVAILVAILALLRILHRLVAANAVILQTQSHLDALLDTSPDPMLVVARDGRIVRANQMAERFFGYDNAGLLSMTVEQLIPERFRRNHRDLRAGMFAEPHDRLMGGGLPLLALTRDGRELQVEISISQCGEGAEQLATITLRDVSAQEQNRRALIEAKLQAEAASAAKSAFLSSMSHELRTPMNAILGFSQLMEYDDTLPDEHQDNVQEILKAGHHLLALINEVLDLSRIESGHIDLSLEPVEVKPIVDECLSLVGTLAEKHAIRVSHSGLQGASVRADRTRLKQALLNLLSNAIKYNREGGCVTLGIQPGDSDRLRIWVADTGPGLSAEALTQLFQPFNRLGAENGNIEGTGIGLTITQRIVELMGGTLEVESEVGVGSTFWIELPLESASDNGASGQHDAAGEVSSPAPEQPVDSARHTVLYIEDNPSNIKLVAQILGRRPHIHLLTAHTPELGIELAQARHPDLVLLDINMPGMDGYQVLKVLKTIPLLSNIPIVAITANALPSDVERGRAAGFTNYLTKPLDIGRLNSVVDACLQRSGQSQPESEGAQ